MSSNPTEEFTMHPPFTQRPLTRTCSDENESPSLASTAAQPIDGDPRASAGWLRNPAWIDGGVNPPRFYYSHEEINATLRVNGLSPTQVYEQQASHISPTPALPAPPAPLTLDLVNSARIQAPSGGGAEVPADRAGHLVNVTLLYIPPSQPAVGRVKVAAPKKSRITKMDNIILESISRVDFIKAFLLTHAVDDKYSPGVHSGPAFKLYWTGISGGKSAAPSIHNDNQFAIALEAILKKNKAKTIISVEFDVGDMEGFRIKDTLPRGVLKDSVEGDDELAYGTRVPQVSHFSEAAQLHGQLIIELKKKWTCQTHQGEYGDSGYCYVAPSGEHTRLNTLRLKTWAAAMAAGDATKHEPPNVNAFDGVNLAGPKPRGRAGPLSSTSSSSTVNPNNDMMVLMLTTLLPLIGGLSRKRNRDNDSSPPRTPKRTKAATSSVHSPLPEPGLELRACLRDFAELEGIDLTSFEIQLRMEDCQADVIPFVDVADLRKITGATTGTIVKLKKFCKEWYTRYQAKLSSQS